MTDLSVEMVTDLTNHGTPSVVGPGLCVVILLAPLFLKASMDQSLVSRVSMSLPSKVMRTSTAGVRPKSRTEDPLSMRLFFGRRCLAPRGRLRAMAAKP